MTEDRGINNSRRDFLIKTVKVTALGAAIGGAGYLLHNRKSEEIPVEAEAIETGFSVDRSTAYPDIAIARGNSPAANTSAVVAALGGMALFVNRGDRVAVKPNIGWDRVPEQAANTNPEVVGEICRLCFEAGASEVIITDNTCNDARMTFARSGIQEAGEKAGAKLIIPQDRDYKEYDLKGTLLNVWPVLDPLVSVDKMINVPVVKHHALSLTTVAMKNLYGILGGRRNRLHQSIDESIVDLASFMRPTLTVVDATRVLMSNGPTGGDLNDVKAFNTVLAGTDQVALDAYSSSNFLGVEISRIKYLALGQERGLGTVDFKTLNIKEEQTG